MKARDFLKKSLEEFNGEGCLNWPLKSAIRGYGVVKIGIGRKYEYCHRLAYGFANGPIPENMVVRHSCDNPACYNPKHLILGTDADNMRDRDMRGRGAKGERSGMAKLTSEQVLKIRASQGTNAAVGKRFSVDHTTVSLIRRRKTWKHLI